MSLISFPVLAAILIISGATIAAGETRYVVRTTSKGQVRGQVERILDKDINVFRGVPFARPPVGELRFKAPQPFPEWGHILNATYLPASCSQVRDDSFDRFEGVEMWNPNTAISEDCLYLNVWEPASANSAKRAVLVWIYGGGLFSGTSTLDLYDGKVLAAVGDVIVVSMQYRVGVLGFLYLGTPDAPGNQGLLDQNLALRWVRDNIDAFGGDPSRVTVFGESAGAFSSNLHLLSPMSRDLVRSGIMQSASALSTSWGFEMPDMAKAKARNLAKQLGCAKKKEHDTVKCLREIKADDLTKKQEAVGNPDAAVASVFVATIDNQFLTEHPIDTLKAGNFKQKSVLLGVNRDEGYYFLAYQQPEYLGRKNSTKDITPDIYLSMVKRVLSLPSGQASIVAETAAFEYGAPYHGKTPTNYHKPLDDVMGDTAFKCPVVDAATWYSKDPKVSVYLYEFNHRTSGNSWPGWMGVMHGYEIDHIFGLPITNKAYRREEEKLSRAMIGYWTNFAKTGDPNRNDLGQTMNVSWPTYRSKDKTFLQFETDAIRTEHGLRERQCEFWRDLVPKIRKATHEDEIFTTGSAIARQCLSSAVIQVSIIVSVLLLI